MCLSHFDFAAAFLTVNLRMIVSKELLRPRPHQILLRLAPSFVSALKASILLFHLVASSNNKYCLTKISLDWQAVEYSHGNLRLLDNKEDIFSCDDQYSCIKLTLEEVSSICFGGCQYKVCLEYDEKATGCPAAFTIGRQTFDISDSEAVCDSTLPGTCFIAEPAGFNLLDKRCVIASPNSIVRFSLKEGSKVCQPDASQDRKPFQETYGTTTVDWTCGRNPDTLVNPELVRFSFP
jgi:hypothetical protein